MTTTTDTIRLEVVESVRRLAAKGERVIKLDDVISDLLNSGLLAGMAKHTRYNAVSDALNWNKRKGNLRYLTLTDHRTGNRRTIWGWTTTAKTD